VVRLLDLCTGTGCISLLFRHEFSKLGLRSKSGLECVGVDISRHAVSLANRNLQKQMLDQPDTMTGGSTDFVLSTVFPSDRDVDVPYTLDALEQRNNATKDNNHWDIVISNPPYISPEEYKRTTARSVRNYEPKIALVPAHEQGSSSVDPGDTFYPALIRMAEKVKASVLLFEVGDAEQAIRVANMLNAANRWRRIEIWRDQPTSSGDIDHALTCRDDGMYVRGRGKMRSVFACADSVAERLEMTEDLH